MAKQLDPETLALIASVSGDCRDDAQRTRNVRVSPATSRVLLRAVEQMREATGRKVTQADVVFALIHERLA